MLVSVGMQREVAKKQIQELAAHNEHLQNEVRLQVSAPIRLIEYASLRSESNCWTLILVQRDTKEQQMQDMTAHSERLQFEVSLHAQA